MNTNQQRKNRQERIRKQIRAVTTLPRLSVHRSNKHIYAQIIDDNSQKTVVSVTEQENLKGTKIERARSVGQELAKEALAKKIKAVAFDKGSYAYHGRVKALAEGAREGGLNF